MVSISTNPEGNICVSWLWELLSCPDQGFQEGLECARSHTRFFVMGDEHPLEIEGACAWDGNKHNRHHYLLSTHMPYAQDLILGD